MARPSNITSDTAIAPDPVGWRSLLFVPADKPERFQKALATNADAVIIDLEDSVSADAKSDARTYVRELLKSPSQTPILVRLNAYGSDAFQPDIQALSNSRPHAYVLPKVSNAEQLNALVETLNANGDETSQIVAIVGESAGDAQALNNFASTAPRVVALTWGAEDLATSLGAHGARYADGNLIDPCERVRCATLMAAKASNILAIDTVFPDVRNQEGLVQYAADSAFLGFDGMLAIHPTQVDIINSAFSPTAEQLDHARRLIAISASHPDAGAFLLDGKMIDEPHLRQARKLLRKAN